jgi:hypothetical protein
MPQATSNTTPGGKPPPFPLRPIDLDAHPDGLLLRLCACLGRMRTAIEDLETAIARTPALTIDGRRMKEMTL